MAMKRLVSPAGDCGLNAWIERVCVCLLYCTPSSKGLPLLASYQALKSAQKTFLMHLPTASVLQTRNLMSRNFRDKAYPNHTHPPLLMYSIRGSLCTDEHSAFLCHKFTGCLYL